MKETKTIKITQEDGKVRTIGEFDPTDKVLYMKRNKSKHFYNKLQAWGIDSKTLDNLILQDGLERIVIIDLDSHQRYVSETSDFISKGTYLNHKPFGLQRFLSESYWKKI
jgi:hypothetical protein